MAKENNTHDETPILLEEQDIVDIITPEDMLVDRALYEIEGRLGKNFIQRHIEYPMPDLDERSARTAQSFKRAHLRFEYLRHNLALGDILETVVEKGFLGGVKKKWSIIIDEIESKLSLIDHETADAIINAVKGVFENKVRIEEFIKKNGPQEIFKILVGDSHAKPQGTVLLQMRGDILMINLSDKLDFGKAWLRGHHQALSNKEILAQSNYFDGFAHTLPVADPPMKINIIVFPTHPASTGRSLLQHEVAHRITDRLFMPDAEMTPETLSSPSAYLDDLFKSWMDEHLRDEMISYMFSIIGHWTDAPNKTMDDTVNHFLSSLLERGEGAAYDFPHKAEEGILIHMIELFPNEPVNTLADLYAENAERYFAAAKEKIALLQDAMVRIKHYPLHYDLLKLLRFERIEKWPRLIHMLENVGDNIDALAHRIEDDFPWKDEKQNKHHTINNMANDLRIYGLAYMPRSEVIDPLTRGLVGLKWANHRMQKHMQEKENT